MRIPSLLLLILSLLTSLGAAEQAPAPAGLKVLTAGHSFHVWMPPLVAEMAKAAGIQGHEQLAISSIGGSKVIQHWDLPPDKNKAKPILEAGKADLFTMAPTFLPDPGIENFTKLGLEHNPRLRLTLQQNWVPYEDPELWLSKSKPKSIDRDTATLVQLRAKHDPYFKLIEDHVRELNARIPGAKIAVVPSGEAVLALRDKVIRGEAPGIRTQNELFTDALGHPGPQIRVLSAYCHFTVIYRRSPVGLPVVSQLTKLPEAEKLNRLLQEIAWKVVTGHKLSGVTP
ncbi:MAG: hypothetical protein RLZ85_1161 [Verrucomicrobiota bacterium]|jgi:hypothetical protein|nr:hypothetical protein [Verrucomicrobiota bacterium]